MAARPLNVQDTTLFNHMRQQDAAVFAMAAHVYSVYIAVRRTNEEALQYIGKKGYVPKRLDCKAKTADFDALVNGTVYKTAGLVVDPGIVGAAAYTGGKYAKALAEWDKFRPHLAPVGANGQVPLYLPEDRSYTVQMDPNSIHYGCVMLSPYGLRTNAHYVHGDYDLYGIIPAADRKSNVFVEETRLGQKHVRSKELLDVQTFVNSRIGVPMVLHGAQEGYSDDVDDKIDVFFPDGITVKSYIGPAAIRALYQNEFEGRPLHKAGTPTTPAGGLWKRG
jgi:hypothetical protein